MHSLPHVLEDRFVNDLDAPQTFSRTIAFCQSLQYTELKLYFLRLLGPFTYAADAAVVESVLAVRRSVQVNEDLQTIFLCPVKCIVQLLHTSDERRSVAKDKIRYRNADRIHAHRPDPCKVALCYVLRAVHSDPFLIDLFWELSRQIILILCRCAVEESRAHPFFQYQPVTKIYTFYIHFLHSFLF